MSLKILKIKKTDAIVILSGMMRINEFENDYKIESGDVDSFLKALNFMILINQISLFSQEVNLIKIGQKFLKEIF